jgi:hypothetical protein
MCPVKLKIPLCIALQIVLAALLAAQSAQMVAAPKADPSAQRFVCNTGYTLEKCKADIAVLQKTLANYPIAELGEWTWVLVRSEDWKAIALPRGIGRECPAFTYYEKRETFIEEALVTQVPGRRAELMLAWQMNSDDLLKYAIAHELGHALCNEKDEAKANRVARMLQEKKPFACEFELASNDRPRKR